MPKLTTIFAITLILSACGASSKPETEAPKVLPPFNTSGEIIDPEIKNYINAMTEYSCLVENRPEAVSSEEMLDKLYQKYGFASAKDFREKSFKYLQTQGTQSIFDELMKQPQDCSQILG